MNPCPEWIHRFIGATMIRVISITNPYRNHPKGTHPYSIEVEAFLTDTLVSGQLY